MRTERDFLGEKKVEDDALYGIHAVRAAENFPDQTRFHEEWYRAMGLVKLACYQTYKRYKEALAQRFGVSSEQTSAPMAACLQNVPLMEDHIIDALTEAARAVWEGKWYAHFIVPAISGGAGTSINMNVNEIITNASLKSLGHPAGDYHRIDPIEQANVFQSTNDVVPTALRIAVAGLLDSLEAAIVSLRAEFERLERQHADTLRIAYTQMQEAVPSSYGKLFGAYSEALSRDWWRVSKCFERIKVVNLGGGAVGTGMAIPRYFIFEVVGTLQHLTKKAFTRSENLHDATSNLDPFVEIHAILKAHAVNLEKICSDLRLLASDVVGRKEVIIPQRQVGSSIMPGKINPVIPEFVVSCCHKIYANDVLVSSLASQGCLDLNAYLPALGHSLLESLKLLIAADQSMARYLVSGMMVSGGVSEEKLSHSSSLTTVLIPYIGYNKASLLAKKMKADGCSIYEANRALNFLEEKRLQTALQPANLVRLGYSLLDLCEE